jgi:DNA topoisomerase-1
LGNCHEFEKQVIEILSETNLKPTEGDRDDSAHPAIYPTGNLPEKNLEPEARKLWNLVVKRFLAVFGEPAIREKTHIGFNIGGNLFYLYGDVTLDKGWVRLYDPFLRLDDVILPSVEEGQEVNVKKMLLGRGFTKPSPRYTASSLLKKMEKEEIGTKATRAGIIQTLYDRKYVSGEKIVVTNLGLEVVDVLKRYCPSIVSLDFTRELEHEMDAIQEGKLTKAEVFSVAVKNLVLATAKLKEAEPMIGQKLSGVLEKRGLEERVVGSCPACHTGQLVILRSKSTGKRFVGCTNYFKGSCKTAFPLPQKGSVKPLRRGCTACGWPVVGILSKGRHVWKLCLNPKCPSKKAERKV